MPNLDKFLDELANNVELEPMDKVSALLHLVDIEPLLKQLKLNAAMAAAGITPASAVDAFASAVLLVGRPDLFTE